MEITIKINKKRPFFAEVPYYLWGEVNYVSDGDCKKPTDQNWNYLYLKNRVNKETVQITSNPVGFTIVSKNAELVKKTAFFLKERCGVELSENLSNLNPIDWDHQELVKRTQKIRADFENKILEPFDDTVFWGSWKWTGKFATEFTLEGRWIMNSLLVNDKRAVNLCASWLKDGTFNDIQSDALRYALEILTNESFKTDKEWVNWYFGRVKLFRGKGEKLFPEPNFVEWKNEK